MSPEQFREVAKSALQLNIEARFFPLDKSIFANSAHPKDITTRLINKSKKLVDKNTHFDPFFYLLFEEGGEEKVFGINLKVFVDRDPASGAILASNVMCLTNAKAYAAVFVGNISKRKLRDIRDTRTYRKMPVSGQAVVSIAQYRDGDSHYQYHKFGQMEDIVFWEPKTAEVAIPPHAVPGRFWNLFYIADQLNAFFRAPPPDKKEKGEGE